MHEEVRRLNFYSRYTRVKERREIESLYTLLGAGKDQHPAAACLSRSTSKLSYLGKDFQFQTNSSPVRMCGKTDLQTLDLANYKKVLAMISQESVSELSSKEPQRPVDSSRQIKDHIEEEHTERKSKEIAIKLEKLQNLDKMFRNSSIGNRLTPRRKKKKQRQADLINVVEEGEGRQEGKESRESSKDQNAPVSMQKNRDQGLLKQQTTRENDHKKQQAKNTKEESEGIRKRISNLLPKNGSDERCLQIDLVQSVRALSKDQQNSSSIVIQRLNINNVYLLKVNQEKETDKKHKNWCESELNHSQSELVLKQHRSLEDEATKPHEVQGFRERVSPRIELKTLEVDIIHGQSQQSLELAKKNNEFDNKCAEKGEVQCEWAKPDCSNELSQQIIKETKHSLPASMQFPGDCSIRQSKQRDESTRQRQLVQVNDAKIFPLTKFEQRVRPNSEYSQLKEQIMDKVPEIDMLHESYLPCKEVISSISSPFHSQLADRKLAESVLDYPPDQLIDRADKEAARHEDAQHTGKLLNQKKSSFKKLILSNRRELNPRLVTSTILNEHHEYEYSSKLMNIGQNNLNLESIHSSNKVTKSILYERNESKPVKLNFKKVIKQGEKNFKTAYKPKSKKNIHEANKQLLRTFFDAN